MKRNTSSILIVCLAASAAVGAGFDLSWHSIDGGGAMRSTSGDFELSGTIGQPDAGKLAGGDFELSGGFWFELTPTDCNADGATNLFDYSSFSECLGGPDVGALSGCECFDADGSGTVDLRDFAATQAAYSGSEP